MIGKIRVLLKIQEHHVAPVASLVQEASKSGETMPNSERNSKMFQRSGRDRDRRFSFAADSIPE